MAALAFEEVHEDVKTDIISRHGERIWADKLIAGSVLKMSKRPQWSKADVKRTGMKLKTRTTQNPDEDFKTEVYVWLFEAPDTDTVTVADDDDYTPDDFPADV